MPRAFGNFLPENYISSQQNTILNVLAEQLTPAVTALHQRSCACATSSTAECVFCLKSAKLILVV